MLQRRRTRLVHIRHGFDPGSRARSHPGPGTFGLERTKANQVVHPVSPARIGQAGPRGAPDLGCSIQWNCLLTTSPSASPQISRFCHRSVSASLMRQRLWLAQPAGRLIPVRFGGHLRFRGVIMHQGRIRAPFKHVSKNRCGRFLSSKTITSGACSSSLVPDVGTTGRYGECRGRSACEPD